MFPPIINHQIAVVRLHYGTFFSNLCAIALQRSHWIVAKRLFQVCELLVTLVPPKAPHQDINTISHFDIIHQHQVHRLK